MYINTPVAILKALRKKDRKAIAIPLITSNIAILYYILSLMPKVYHLSINYIEILPKFTYFQTKHS